MLLQILAWQVGILTDFTVSVGKCGKYLEQYLPPDS
jgi:aminoglycoside 6-adenylyltransferase